LKLNCYIYTVFVLKLKNHEVIIGFRDIVECNTIYFVIKRIAHFKIRKILNQSLMSLYFRQLNPKLSANITFYQFTKAKKIAEIPNVFENCKSLSVIFVNLRLNLYFLDLLKFESKFLLSHVLKVVYILYFFALTYFSPKYRINPKS